MIRNKFIPFPGFSAINLFGVIFAREGAYISETTIRHESIHTAQMRELLFVPFYLWYVIEWLVRLCLLQSSRLAYRNISFEREAYANEKDPNYLSNRDPWSFLRYLGRS